MHRPPPTSTLFPYTTLFRSDHDGADGRQNLTARSGDPGHRLVHGGLQTRHGSSSRSSIASSVDQTDRKSTRLNSSHRCISYAVFCLKKKKKTNTQRQNTKRQ